MKRIPLVTAGLLLLVACQDATGPAGVEETLELPVAEPLAGPLGQAGSLSCDAVPEGLEGLVSWWPADGDANDIAGDNHGTLENGAGFGAGFVTAGTAQAFSLDGVDDFVNVPDSPSLDAISTAITVVAWINPQSSPTAGSGWIVSRRDPFASEGFSLAVTNKGKVMIVLRTTSATSVFASDPEAIVFNEYQHVAATYSSATGLLKAYVDGEEVALTNIDSPGLPLSGTLFPVSSLFMGRRQSSMTPEGASGGGHFKGMLDEVGVHSVALTQSQIGDMVAAGISAATCQGSGSVPFAQFEIERAQVKLDRGKSGEQFEVFGRFALGTGSDGIDLLNEDVIVSFGDFSATIPAGTFVRDDEDEGFRCKRCASGLDQVAIRDDGKFRVHGRDLDLSGLSLHTPVPFGLYIGDDGGETEIPFDEHGHYQSRRSE